MPAEPGIEDRSTAVAATTPPPNSSPVWAIACDHVTKDFWEKESDGASERRGADGAADRALLRPLRWALRPPRRRVRAVEAVSFRVPKGEIYGILGPNGSGKSTLIRLVATLLFPDAGTIEVFGRDVVREQFAVRQLINRVSVEASFFKKLSAMENLSYAARLYQVPIKRARREIVEILGRLGLSRSKVFTPLENLSRGMQQKVAIARALLTSPVLILLDEPTTGLDPKSKLEVQEFVLEIQRDHDATILLTTHDMREAERLCQRVAIMHEGRFVAEGTPAALKAAVPAQAAAGRGEPDLEDAFLYYAGSPLKGDEPHESGA